MATFNGTNYDDIITGGSDGDIISGGKGNDTLSGSHGNDSLSGGDGNDTLSGGKGNDSIFGGKDEDTAVFMSRMSDYDLQDAQGKLGSTWYPGRTLTSKIMNQYENQGDKDFVANDVEYIKFSDGILKTSDMSFTPNQPVAGISLSKIQSDLRNGAIQLVDVHHEGSDVYILHLRNISSSNSRIDPDGVKSYLSDVYLTKINSSGQVTSDQQLDSIYAGGGYAQTTRGTVSVSSTGNIDVFITEKTAENNYGQNGYQFSGNGSGNLSKTTLFENVNWGWNPYFDQTGLNHFSYAGYYAMHGTTTLGSITPAAFQDIADTKRIANSGLSGDVSNWDNLVERLKNDVLQLSSSSSQDTAAPTITSFSPADEATGVVAGSKIVITFSEAIQFGTGQILLKHESGTTYQTFQAGGSGLSINGSTLTISPFGGMIAAGTLLRLELPAGAIKDLAGNNFAGSTSYNFTTASATQPPTQPATASKDDQFIILQPGSPNVVGAGTGNDTYLISGSMLPAGKSLTISDAIGNNSIQLAPGLSIASSQVAASALKLNLSNGATVTVLGANNFSYESGGNTSAGRNNTDVSYQSLVTGTLGTTLPTSGVSSGSSRIIDSMNAANLLASSNTGDDFVALQFASPAVVGAGVGNDTYLITNDLLPAGTNLTISDAQGSNSIQLANGLKIASSQVASSALKLTLDSGATITILGANNFTYDVGGNTSAGIDNVDVSYATLVQNTLGATQPTTGVVTGGAVTVGGGSAVYGIPVSGNNTVVASAASESFYFDAILALADTAGTNTQATISGFGTGTAGDVLTINLPNANAAITTLAQLNGQQGVSVQTNEINGTTLVNFGNDSNGGEAVTLTLTGVSNPGLVNIRIGNTAGGTPVPTDPGTGANAIAVTGMSTVSASPTSETFYFDSVLALIDSAGTNTQATIKGFAGNDLLRINLPAANANITNLAQLNGQQGVSVTTNPFDGATVISFGNDSKGGEIVGLTLTGITDPSLVNVQIV
jgi:hypothetical protein